MVNFSWTFPTSKSCMLVEENRKWSKTLWDFMRKTDGGEKIILNDCALSEYRRWREWVGNTPKDVTIYAAGWLTETGRPIGMLMNETCDSEVWETNTKRGMNHWEHKQASQHKRRRKKEKVKERGQLWSVPRQRFITRDRHKAALL